MSPSQELHWYPVRPLFLELYFGEHYASSVGVGSVCPGATSWLRFCSKYYWALLVVSGETVSCTMCRISHCMPPWEGTLSPPLHALSYIPTAGNVLTHIPSSTSSSPFRLEGPPSPGKVQLVLTYNPPWASRAFWFTWSGKNLKGL